MRCSTILFAIALIAAPMPAASAQPDPPEPPEFVALGDVDPTILQDIRYATSHNFTGDPIDGYRAPTCILTRPAAEALSRA